jgi:LysR family glycine cleavage system transcriptional activator
MNRPPSFLALRAFEAAARVESFALAADELHLTPSAISHQIRDLEEHFGRPLFLRLHRRVKLTAAGQTLLGGLSSPLRQIEAVCAQMRPATTCTGEAARAERDRAPVTLSVKTASL